MYTIKDVAGHLLTPGFGEIINRHYDACMESGPRGTLRAFFEPMKGRTILTVQGGSSPWVVKRTVDTVAASRVVMDGSSRYYRGMKVIGRTADAVLCRDTTTGAEVLYVAIGLANRPVNG